MIFLHTVYYVLMWVSLCVSVCVCVCVCVYNRISIYMIISHTNTENNILAPELQLLNVCPWLKRTKSVLNSSGKF